MGGKEIEHNVTILMFSFRLAKIEANSQQILNFQIGNEAVEKLEFLDQGNKHRIELEKKFCFLLNRSWLFLLSHLIKTHTIVMVNGLMAGGLVLLLITLWYGQLQNDSYIFGRSL